MNVENILDNIATSVIITNKYMEIVHVNASGENFLRNSKEKLLNKKINDIFAKKNNLIINQIYDAIALGQSSISRDMDISLKSKIKHIVDCNVQAIYIDKEKHVLLEILQNQRHKSIEKNARFNDRNNATQMITRSIAHEIKNPLGGIRGAAQLLDSEIEKNQKEYTEIIDQVSKKNFQLNQKPLNVHAILEKIPNFVDSLNLTADSVERDYDPSIPEVRIDNDMIIQALLNILKNAQEATVEGGTVLIKTRVERNYTISSIRYNLVAMIDIIDDGIGISPDIKSKLFLPLVTNKPKGSGLRLSISQKLVSLNNGIIVYEDDDARTIFKIILPIENY